jgi:hypothetical protein
MRLNNLVRRWSGSKLVFEQTHIFCDNCLKPSSFPCVSGEAKGYPDVEAA